MADDMAETLTPLDEAAMGMHELFCSLMRGGFTEEQALTIVAKIASSGTGE